MVRFGTISPPPGSRIRAALAHAVLVRAAGAAAAPLAGRLGPLARARMERGWAATLRRALGMRLRLAGAEHIVAGERYVVAALHESPVDPVALLALPLPMRWVVRREILDWPDAGPYARRAGHVAIRPEDGPAALRALLRAGEAAEAAAVNLAIFPQGTMLGIETRFAPGAAVLAARLGRPLLPVVLTGTHRVWGYPLSPELRFGQAVAVQVLPPVPPETVESAYREVEAAMKRVALTVGPPPRRFVPERDGWWDGYRYEIDPAYPKLAARVTAHRAAYSRGGSPKIARGPSPAA